MIFRAGRKKKEEVVGKPGPGGSGFGGAERSSEDGDGEDSLDEREVTIVNKPSSNILNNPFSQPGVSPLQFPSREAKTREKGSTLSRPFPKRISDSLIITRQLR